MKACQSASGRATGGARVGRLLNATVQCHQNPGGWDPLVLLSALGQRPPEIGTAILATYPRHPVTTATEALTVQSLIGGQLVLGVGPSHAWYVQDQLGIPYTSPVRHTRDYLTILRPLLHGQPVHHRGEFFTVETALHITAAPPTLLMAALGPRMLQVARELADGVVTTFVTPKLIAEHVVSHLSADARIVVQVITMPTNQPEHAHETIARDFAAIGDMPAYRASLDRAGLTSPADTVIIGDERAITQALTRFRDAGATDLIISPLDSPENRATTLDIIAAFPRSPN
ncbi:MAG: LLM class flavin-dependent oxidoreductase [Pseudonocardiales bacterium]|nr:LLM class flavin-dependent oxidoreductase [Pseudonocardiales bacterium]